jgi:hypothetical protein
MNIDVSAVNYLNEQNAQDLSDLLSCYALDPMGGATALPVQTLKNLASQLAKVPHAFSFIAYVDGKAAGLINCFEAFSTFKCAPLISRA